MYAYSETLGSKRKLTLKIFRELDPKIKNDYDFYVKTKSLKIAMKLSNSLKLICDSLSNRDDFCQFKYVLDHCKMSKKILNLEF